MSFTSNEEFSETDCISGFHQDNEASVNVYKGFHIENWSLNQPLQCSHQGQGSYLRFSLLVSIHACGFKSSPGNDSTTRAPARTNTHTHTQKSPFHDRGLEYKIRKPRDTWTKRQVWPWSTK